MRKAARTKALYAGSFDPITRGHLDIIGKALMTFDAVHVAIGTNVKKQRAFGVEESQRLIVRSIVEHWPGPAPVWWRVEGLGLGYRPRCHFVLLFRVILWFGPRRSHSSAPTRTMVRLSRAAAVKDGPFLGPPGGLVLDGRKRGGKLVCVGINCYSLKLTLPSPIPVIIRLIVSL